MTTRAPERVGQVIGQRYELLQVIGRGGQGMVYRALDRWDGRSVAVKVLGSKAAREPQVLERLMREQQALSALKGTSAVELFDVCRGNDGELCLVMELLKGVDLDDHLFSLEQRGERLALQRVADIFEPIVSTLETAHAAGILHRDLKPANIFLVEGGDVRLLDFGMARLKKSAPLTAAGTVMGSPSFMAPEAWKGVSDLLDQRADVYSLGVILFRVLAGQLPFEAATLKDKLLSATTSPRPSLLKFRPELPRAADAWVSTALAVDREQRFASVGALWNAFSSVFHVRSSRSQRPSFWASAKGAVRRFARGSQPAPPAAPTPSSNESSFTRDALARSVMRTNTPTPEARPPYRPAPPPRPTPQKPPVEKTLSMSDSDIVYDVAAPDAPASTPKADGSSNEK